MSPRNGTFGAWVLHALIDLGLSQTALAKRLGCSRQHVSSLVGRRLPPRDKALRRVEKALGRKYGKAGR